MERLFGTDGVRGRANQYPITPEMIQRIGRAVALFFQGQSVRPRIVIGKDTRLSGDMIEAAAASGVASAGVDAVLTGVLPTPGVALAVRQMEAAAGIVISASHNPYFDNGIKVFDKEGYKLTDAQEEEIELLVREDAPVSGDPGTITRMSVLSDRYTDFLVSTFPGGLTLAGMKIVVDCAHGATFAVAPRVFARLGALVRSMGINPDGKNINVDRGSQAPEALMEEVVRQKADLGVAFDGDGDRCIAVDEKGRRVTGDQILAVCTKLFKQEGRLAQNTVVSTVMSNLGLRKALRQMGVEHVVTDVGDRYVFSAMRERGACLGGEDSGHLVFLSHHTTGDGILTALQLAAAVVREQKPLSELVSIMDVFPQVLLNVPVSEKPDLATVPAVQEAVRMAEEALGTEGRVLVRYSGTRSVCRVMVEGPTEELTRKTAEDIAGAVKDSLAG